MHKLKFIILKYTKADKTVTVITDKETITPILLIILRNASSLEIKPNNGGRPRYDRKITSSIKELIFLVSVDPVRLIISFLFFFNMLIIKHKVVIK